MEIYFCDMLVLKILFYASENSVFSAYTSLIPKIKEGI